MAQQTLRGTEFTLDRMKVALRDELEGSFSTRQLPHDVLHDRKREVSQYDPKAVRHKRGRLGSLLQRSLGGRRLSASVGTALTLTTRSRR